MHRSMRQAPALPESRHPRHICVCVGICTTGAHDGYQCQRRHVPCLRTSGVITGGGRLRTHVMYARITSTVHALVAELFGAATLEGEFTPQLGCFWAAACVCTWLWRLSPRLTPVLLPLSRAAIFSAKEGSRDDDALVAVTWERWLKTLEGASSTDAATSGSAGKGAFKSSGAGSAGKPPGPPAAAVLAVVADAHEPSSEGSLEL